MLKCINSDFNNDYFVPNGLHYIIPWLYIDMAGFSFFFLVDIRRGNGGEDVLDVVADEVFDVKGV